MICPICDTERDKSEFLKRSDSPIGVRLWAGCSTCRKEKRFVDKDKINARKRQRWSDNRETINAKSRARYDPKKKKAQHLKHLYGISMEEYNRMFLEQEGCCAVCKTHQSKLRRALAVDHDHATNRIRGLLCDKCNLLLGQFADKPDVLWSAALYLNQYIGQVPGQSPLEVSQAMANESPALMG